MPYVVKLPREMVSALMRAMIPPIDEPYSSESATSATVPLRCCRIKLNTAARNIILWKYRVSEIAMRFM